VAIVGMGFVGGHMLHILGYHPEILREEGFLTLFKIWGGLSSTGGFLGAIVGGIVFFRFIRKVDPWIHGDVIAWSFPFAWIFARSGCFTAHDHQGVLSNFFLAVDFPSGARHDLGLYEALYMFVVAGLFWAFRKKKTKPGFYLALLPGVYAPVRFGLDFLRSTDQQMSDLRHLGLTPAQWVTLGLLLVSGAIALRLRGEAPADPRSEEKKISE
jgi:phosphatidylglycerol:prolipoprotein diacylglycerol transferase